MILLTGATGFVGSALLQHFINNEEDVTALVRNESVFLPTKVNQIIINLENLAHSPQDDLMKALYDHDVVIHMAARVHIMHDEAVDPLTEYRKVNRDATLALAKLAARAGIKRFVFISSIKVNGENSKHHELFKPEINQPPIDPYGLSKYEAEKGLQEIAYQTGMEVVIIRPPLVYGHNVKGNFASMIHWIKKGIPLPLGAISNKRSLVALDNLVDFIALCADCKRSPKAANEVFLISDDEDISTSNLLRKVAQACGVKSRLLPIPVGIMKFIAKIIGKKALAERLFGDLQVDNSKARHLLNWKPVVTMDEALERMFQD